MQWHIQDMQFKPDRNAVLAGREEWSSAGAETSWQSAGARVHNAAPPHALHDHGDKVNLSRRNRHTPAAASSNQLHCMHANTTNIHPAPLHRPQHDQAYPIKQVPSRSPKTIKIAKISMPSCYPRCSPAEPAAGPQPGNRTGWRRSRHRP